MSIIKPKRGTGTPAGSIVANEIAMDTTSRTLYTSTDGSDAVIIGNDTEYFLANNTISGLTNETPTYNGVIKSIRQNTAQNFVLTGAEIVRDLGSDGAVSGNEPRTASLDFSIKSDATNTNNAPQNIYAGGFYGGSGSNDGTGANYLACFAYDDGITSFSKPIIWEGTKDYFKTEVELQANEGILTEKVTITAPIGSTNANLIIDQDQYTTNGIELLADKSASDRNQLWFNYDNNGTKEYVGGHMWRVDGGSAGSGDHYYRVASWTNGPQSDVIFDHHKNDYTRIANGYYDSSNTPLGEMRLNQDTVTIDGLGLNVETGRRGSTGTLSPNTLRVSTDMSQDTSVSIQNSATYVLDYGSSAIPTTYTQNTMTFTVQNDAGETAGDDPVVGRISAVRNADPLLNQMILRSSNHGNTGGNADNGATQGGDMSLTSYKLDVNVPVALPVYTVTEANALSNVDDGSLIYVSNGNAGAKTLAVWDGSDWKVVALGATIS